MLYFDYSAQQGYDTCAMVLELCQQAYARPDSFGPIRLFRYARIEGATLLMLPTPEADRGMFAFSLGRTGGLRTVRRRAQQALEQFGLALEQASLPPAFFEELPHTDLAHLLAQLCDQLRSNTAQVLLRGYEPAPGDTSTAVPAAPAPINNQVLVAFAQRVHQSALWDDRKRASSHEASLDRFSLIAAGVLGGHLPLHERTTHPGADALGVEVYQYQQSATTLLVLYTGDPTAVFVAALNDTPTGSAARASLVTALSEHLQASGIQAARFTRPPAQGAFTQLTDPNLIVQQLNAALALEGGSRHTILDPDRFEDRPTGAEFEVLAQWVLEHPQHRGKAERAEAPGANFRLWAHRDFALTTVLAVSHADSAVSFAGFFDSEMAPQNWPADLADFLTGEAPPAGFRELEGPEALQQLRRARAAFQLDSGVTQTQDLHGTPSPATVRRLTTQVATSRLRELHAYRVSFPGIVEAWQHGEQNLPGRPRTFIAQQVHDEQLILLGAITGAETNVFVIANEATPVDLQQLGKHLTAEESAQTLEQALRQLNFRIPAVIVAQQLLSQALHRILKEEAAVYEVEPVLASH